MDPSAQSLAGRGGAPARARAVAAARALRLPQWAKNVLVFLPVLGAHRAGDADAVLRSARAFVAFGLAASAAYVVNDVADLAADRQHPRKRARPFAAGELPAAAALLLAPALLVAAGAVALSLPPGFAALLAGYFLVTVAYSLGLKRLALVDVFVLGGLYTSRVFAGALATGIPVSPWLTSFSLFLFLSLALLKRGAELVAAPAAPPGRGYLASDREAVFTMGIAAGYLSVLVLALYVSSPEILRLYPSPAWLWALCPLVLFWVSHLWLRTRRGEVEDDDPLMFALAQKATWIVLLLGTVVVIAASRGRP